MSGAVGPRIWQFRDGTQEWKELIGAPDQPLERNLHLGLIVARHMFRRCPRLVITRQGRCKSVSVFREPLPTTPRPRQRGSAPRWSKIPTALAKSCAWILFTRQSYFLCRAIIRSAIIRF